MSIVWFKDVFRVCTNPLMTHHGLTKKKKTKRNMMVLWKKWANLHGVPKNSSALDKQ